MVNEIHSQRFKKLLSEARRRIRDMDRSEVENGVFPTSLLFKQDLEMFLRTVMSAIEAGVETKDFGTVLDAYVMLELALDKEYLRELSEFMEKIGLERKIEKFIIGFGKKGGGNKDSERRGRER